jgi:pimeloyl-ACP methyl ester carboxylesterase
MTGTVGTGVAWLAVRVGDAVFETARLGSGEPVVWIQTALVADELVPAAGHLASTGRYQSVAYHRLGYAGSSPSSGEGSIRQDARDCLALMDMLNLGGAHVVGASYSAAVALQLAADAPARVASLCVVEPPPVHIPAAAEFRAANDTLQAEYRTEGAQTAVDRFLSRLMGPDWQHDITQHLPEGVAQINHDAETFFGTDIPALLSWDFTRTDAACIRAPVLYVGGSDSGPWFADVHSLIRDWLPDAEDVVFAGAAHSLPLTHAGQLAATISSFLDRHRVSARKSRRR